MLNSKSSRGKSVVPTVLVLLILTAAVIIAWYYWAIIDREPPTADPVDVTIIIGETVRPEDFVTNVEDESEVVSIEFVNMPNLMSHTNQAVQIRITDEHGNSAIFEATLIIRLNTSPPVIEGVEPIVTRVGDPILYRVGITARDDFGRDLTNQIQINSTNVNHNAVGEYSVTYQVRDLTGLETIIQVPVKVVNVDVEYVHNEIDKILASIIRDDMTQLQKVRRIHTWVDDNLSYAQQIGAGESVYEDAYRALRDRGGNCFNFYAISEIMLTRAGIPNMPIERIPGTPTRHRWSLVNPDGLGWHHFDTTPTRLLWGSQTAFFTDSQARAFTRQFVEFNGTEDYFTYEPELYPSIVQ
jgi:C4-type Zn-finger protein